MMPNTQMEELSELQAVLTSKIFSRAPNLSRILSYICREHFDGRTSNIKEYNIAVHALGRGPSFDPARDSIVRVEVSRLRKRLQQYYETEGAQHALEIQLSEAGYVPRFVRRQPSAPPVSAALPKSGRKPVLYSGIGIALAICSGVLINSRVHLPGSNAQSSSPVPAVNSLANTAGDSALLTEVRIAAGSTTSKYLDYMGRVWESDRHFKGGAAISRPERQIERTFDTALYRNAREGDFQYDIPLKPGIYELHLHFAEIVYQASQGSFAEGRRRFHVVLNNKPLLSDFDIAVDAPGANIADERVFKDVSPAEDGQLHLRFESFYGKALLNAVEIVPGIPGGMHPVRILTGLRKYYDRKERFWGPDRYFSSGNFYLRPTQTRKTPDPELFGGERFGNFRYFIPVAEGRYAVTLRFAESNFGVTDFGVRAAGQGPVGNRLFDIYCNDTVLEKDFDVIKEAGGPNVALERTFHGLKPNAQGKLVLSFVPVRDYATVRSIEVVSE
jgi:hypothetical protein